MRLKHSLGFTPLVLCFPGSLSFILDMNSSLALVLAVIPPAIYLGLCFKLKTDTQITIAAILSIIYAFLMLVVSMSIVGKLQANRNSIMPNMTVFLSKVFDFF